MTSYSVERRLDQMLSSQGDGSGTTDQNAAGKSITGASTASPTVVTCTGHGYSAGDWLWIDGATGTTEINGLREIATVPNANTFTLYDEAGASVGSAGTFGGTVDSNLAFVCKPSSTETYELARINVAGGDESAWVVGGMLGVAALSNGIIVAVYDSSGLVQTLTPTPIKGWHHWAMPAGVDMGLLGDVANNKFEAAVRWTFAKSAPYLRLRGAAGEMLVMYSQDDLDGLSFLQAAVQGETV